MIPGDRTGGVTEGAGSGFMQSPFWASFKARTGWKTYIRPAAEASGDSLVVLVRSLGPGFHFAYVPHAPTLPPGAADPCLFLESLAASLAASITERLLFIRFDLAWNREGKQGSALLESIGKGKTRLRQGTAVQVPDTVILDISGTEEEILAGMKPKWRYNIKLAEKKGVEVGREGVEALDAFYALYLETAKRDGIAIHPLSYYRQLFETAAEAAAADELAGPARPGLSVWVARYEGIPIASIITLFQGRQATYLYGASSGEKRNLMPAYALQWKAIQAARAEGCAEYDFFGIPPDDDPSHPMAGLYLFKTGFGGTILHRAGSIDYPVSSLAYRLFRAAEALRLFWFKKVRKKFR